MVDFHGLEGVWRTLVQYTFEVQHLLDVVPGQFLVISHDRPDLITETIQDWNVADEKEARTFELLAWRFPTTSSGAEKEEGSRSTGTYKVQDKRQAVVSLPANKTFTS